LRTFLLADFGLELYGNGIAATEDTIAKNSDVLKRFVRASLKGWKFALANPQKAARDEIQYVPTLKPDGIVAELGVVGDLAVTADSEKNGLGWFDPAKMKANVDFVAKYIGINGTPPAATDIYAPGFLPATPVMP
jgi:NitT/TauT family transport system substrate-binding protein